MGAGFPADENESLRLTAEVVSLSFYATYPAVPFWALKFGGEFKDDALG